jgi:hypothetical protein
MALNTFGPRELEEKVGSSQNSQDSACSMHVP